MDDYGCRYMTAVLGHPGFGWKTGTMGGFERVVNENDCIILALITAIHRVYDLQLKSRYDVASIYEYNGFRNLKELLRMNFFCFCQLHAEFAKHAALGFFDISVSRCKFSLMV